MSKKNKVVTLREEKMLPAIFAVLPAIIFSAVVILQVRANYYYMPFTQFFWTEKTDETQNVDFFSMCKREWIVIAAILAILYLIFLVITGELKLQKLNLRTMNKIYICMAVYVLMVLVSFLFSDLKFIAWGGSFERFEGTITILGYMACLLFIMLCVNNPKRVTALIGGIFVMLLIIGFLGYFQSVGKDFFRSGIGQKFITPNTMLSTGKTAWETIDELWAEGKTLYTFNFTNKQVYQTVFNINYTPLYLSAVLPLVATTYFYASTKLLSNNVVKGLLAAFVSIFVFGISLWNFFCGNSASGYFGLVVMFVMALIIFRKKLIHWIKPALLILLVVAFVMSTLRDRWLPEVKSKVLAEIPKVYAEEVDEKISLTVDEILTGDDYFKIVVTGKTLYGKLDANKNILFVDENDVQYNLHVVEGEVGTYAFDDPLMAKRCKIIMAQDETSTYVFVKVGGTEFRFCISDTPVQFLTPVGKKASIGPVETFGFEGKYRFGSGRGYIWSRSIPMIKHTLLWGNGADTYCFKFPQHDYAGKFTYQTLNTVTDKPHSLYLGMAINTGLVSLIAWIGMVVFLIIDSIKHCLKLNGENEFIDFTGAGALIGVCSFAIVALFNDSSVSTMPLFYSVFGLCFACNRMHKEPEAKKD